MAAIYSNGGNRWNILGFNFTKRDALSSVYKISMIVQQMVVNLQSFYCFTCTRLGTTQNRKEESYGKNDV